MDQIDIHKIRLMRKVMSHLQFVQTNMLSILKEDRFLAEADWGMVEQLTHIRNPYEHWEYTEREPKKTDVVHSEQDAQREEARLRLLHFEKVSYWRQFGKGLLSHRSINCLLDEVEELAEHYGAMVTVAELRKSWDVQPMWTRLQQVVSYTNDSHMRYQSSMHDRRPKVAFLREVYDILFSRYWDIFIIILILLDITLNILEVTGVIKQPHDKLDLALFVIYSIFVIEFILKAMAIGRNYFKSKRNLFDITFVFIYIGCIVCLVLNSRIHHKELYTVLEVLACLRIFRLYFLLPVILPNVLEFVNSKINAQVGLSYDTAKGFIVGEEDAHKHIRKLVENPKIAEEFRETCQQRRLDAIRYLAELQTRMPGCTTSVKTKQAAQFCLNGLQEALTEMRESGLVNEKEFEDLSEAVMEKILGIANAPPWMRTVPFDQQLQHMNWLDQNQELIRAILENSIEIDYMEGEEIYKRGEKSDGLYIISAGMVRVITDANDERNPNSMDYIHAGRYFGEMSTITGEPRSATMVADVKTTCYHIGTAKLLEIISRHKNLYWQFVISYCVQKCSSTLQNLPPFDAWPDSKLREHLGRGDLIDLYLNGRYDRRDDDEILVLIRGDVKCHNRKFSAHSNAVIIPEDVSIVERDPTAGTVTGRAIWLFAVPPANPTVRKWVGDNGKRRTSTPHAWHAEKRVSLAATFNGTPPVEDPELDVAEFGSDSVASVGRMFSTAHYARRLLKKRSSIHM